MEFMLTEEQQLIEDTVARLLEKQWDPRRDQALLSADVARLPLWHELAELGLLGIALPEEHGGGGMGPMELTVLCRRFGRDQLRSPFLSSLILAGTALTCSPLSALRDQWLRRLATGDAALTLATLEDGAGYDHHHTAIEGQRCQQGYVLNGRKRAVMDAAGVDAFIVSCRLNGELALVLLAPETEGMAVASYAAFDGSSLATLTFNDVLLPEEAVLARGAEARAALDAALAHGALAAAAETLGACEGALEQTLDYLRLREQFGTKLARFQALQHRASDLHADLEMLRSLVSGAAQSLTHEPAHADAFAAMALAVPVGDRVCREAIQMHGGIGMTLELGIGRYLLRVNALSRLLGDATHNGRLYLERMEA